MSDNAILIINYFLIVILIGFSALFSGLTLGLLGLDLIGLDIVIAGDDEVLKEKAAKIKPIRENGNMLLCTLLLGNVAVNAYLSILMADLTSGFVGFAVSTIAIFLFGEIIPQASCSRYALHIGAVCIPIVKALMFLMYPVTKPMSMLLDYVLGEELGTIHSRKELTELLRIHVAHGAMDVETGQISAGAITYQDKKVSEVMSPYGSSYIISASDLLNFQKITEIFKSGYSRIPVFEKDRHDIIGILLVKDLIFVDPDDETPVRNFIQIFGRNFHLIWPDDKLGDVLKVFKKGKSHIAIVRDVNNEGDSDPWYEMKGIVTLEDILEEILQDEIVDETDMAGGEGVGDIGAFDYGKLRLLDSGKLEYDKLTKNESLAIGAHFLRNVKSFNMSMLDNFYASFRASSSGMSGMDEAVEVDGRDLTSTTQSPAMGTTAVGAVDNTKRRMSQNSAASYLMECLLDSCPVIDQNRISHTDAAPDNRDYLYSTGTSSDYMVMVLTGKLTVLAGKDQFRAEAGPWTVIGADALYTVPDADGSGISGKEIGFVPDFSAYVASEHCRYIKITNAQYNRALRGDYVFRQEIKSKGQVFREQQQAAGEGNSEERLSTTRRRGSSRSSERQEALVPPDPPATSSTAAPGTSDDYRGSTADGPSEETSTLLGGATEERVERKL